MKLVVNPPKPWPNWQAPVSTRKNSFVHASGVVSYFRAVGMARASCPVEVRAASVQRASPAVACLLALLTPDESAQSQRHLQSALYALTTLGSVVGLYGYLWLYETSSPSGATAANSAAMDADLSFSAIWWASAALLAVSVVAVVAAGEGSTVGHVLRDPPAATPAAARAADDPTPKPRTA